MGKSGNSPRPAESLAEGARHPPRQGHQQSPDYYLENRALEQATQNLGTLWSLEEEDTISTKYKPRSTKYKLQKQQCCLTLRKLWLNEVLAMIPGLSHLPRQYQTCSWLCKCTAFIENWPGRVREQSRAGVARLPTQRQELVLLRRGHVRDHSTLFSIQTLAK